MSALFVVLPLALLVSSLAVVAFVISVRRGEFDDLETPARRILVDDEPERLDASPRQKTAG